MFAETGVRTGCSVRPPAWPIGGCRSQSGSATGGSTAAITKQTCVLGWVAPRVPRASGRLVRRRRRGIPRRSAQADDPVRGSNQSHAWLAHYGVAIVRLTGRSHDHNATGAALGRAAPFLRSNPGYLNYRIHAEQSPDAVAAGVAKAQRDRSSRESRSSRSAPGPRTPGFGRKHERSDLLEAVVARSTHIQVYVQMHHDASANLAHRGLSLRVTSDRLGLQNPRAAGCRPKRERGASPPHSMSKRQCHCDPALDVRRPEPRATTVVAAPRATRGAARCSLPVVSA